MEQSDLVAIENPDLTGTARTRSVPVLVRAMSVLEILAASRNGLTLPEVARRLDLPKSSTHSILLTLLRGGYVTRSPRTRRFVLGFKLFSLANQALNGLRLRELATPLLQSLMLTTNLTVHMAIFDRHEAILIAKIDPPGGLGLSTWIGRHMELHCTGVGKALLAYVPEPVRDQLIRQRTFPQHNENTIVSAKRLSQEMAKVREAGFALDDEEDEVGFRCIGVPVFASDGAVLAAISIAGTTLQVTNENTKDLVVQLKRTAGFITAASEKDEEFL